MPAAEGGGMKPETILNAMSLTKIQLTLAFHGIRDLPLENVLRLSRQNLAFRDRIIKMFEEKDHEPDTDAG